MSVRAVCALTVVTMIKHITRHSNESNEWKSESKNESLYILRVFVYSDTKSICQNIENITYALITFRKRTMNLIWFYFCCDLIRRRRRRRQIEFSSEKRRNISKKNGQHLIEINWVSDSMQNKNNWQNIHNTQNSSNRFSLVIILWNECTLSRCNRHTVSKSMSANEQTYI